MKRISKNSPDSGSSYNYPEMFSQDDQVCPVCQNDQRDNLFQDDQIRNPVIEWQYDWVPSIKVKHFWSISPPTLRCHEFADFNSRDA